MTCVGVCWSVVLGLSWWAGMPMMLPGVWCGVWMLLGALGRSPMMRVGVWLRLFPAWVEHAFLIMTVRGVC